MDNIYFQADGYQREYKYCFTSLHTIHTYFLCLIRNGISRFRTSKWLILDGGEIYRAYLTSYQVRQTIFLIYMCWLDACIALRYSEYAFGEE